VSEQPTKDVLSKSLRLALEDCAQYHKHRPYIWKQKSMEKLEALGYVQKEPLIYAGCVTYSPTLKGREYIASCA
jgi:hypothetical protein